jgi:methionine biosynthesis protein MetW
MNAADLSQLRPDLARICDWIAPGSRILDLGCGDAGVNVVQADLDEGLADFSTGSFDYVVMTQALQALVHPDHVLGEMLRVGREAIVTFPNFGHWRVRLAIAGGRMPLTAALPAQWYETPNIHLCTVADFEDLCRSSGWQVLQRALLDRRHRGGAAISWLPNLFCEAALYKLRRPATPG